MKIELIAVRVTINDLTLSACFIYLFYYNSTVERSLRTRLLSTATTFYTDPGCGRFFRELINLAFSKDKVELRVKDLCSLFA